MKSKSESVAPETRAESTRGKTDGESLVRPGATLLHTEMGASCATEEERAGYLTWLLVLAWESSTLRSWSSMGSLPFSKTKQSQCDETSMPACSIGETEVTMGVIELEEAGEVHNLGGGYLSVLSLKHNKAFGDISLKEQQNSLHKLKS